MGNCPTRARTLQAREVSTQTIHAYNCNFQRMNRYYDFVGSVSSVEAPANIRITTGYVRDVAVQGPTTCIHTVECEGFEGVGIPEIGRLVPLPKDKFHAIGVDLRLR